MKSNISGLIPTEEFYKHGKDTLPVFKLVVGDKVKRGIVTKEPTPVKGGYEYTFKIIE